MNDLIGPEMAERLAIRELIENWVLWRDAVDWDRFRERCGTARAG
jgi:hypothetical protein